MGDVVFSVPWLLPVTVPEEIHCVLNEFLILLCSYLQEVPSTPTMSYRAPENPF